MEETQLKLGDDLQKKIEELKKKQIENKKRQKERAERERYFKDNFKYGSTTVLKRNGQFFFWGDIAHCDQQNVFHNASKIKSLMKQNDKTRGHMNYDDPPTFDSDWTWENEENERKTIYKDDLYKFVGEKIVVADLIGSEPIGYSILTKLALAHL